MSHIFCGSWPSIFKFPKKNFFTFFLKKKPNGEKRETSKIDNEKLNLDSLLKKFFSRKFTFCVLEPLRNLVTDSKVLKTEEKILNKKYFFLFLLWRYYHYFFSSIGIAFIKKVNNKEEYEIEELELFAEIFLWFSCIWLFMRRTIAIPKTKECSFSLQQKRK